MTALVLWVSTLLSSVCLVAANIFGKFANAEAMSLRREVSVIWFS